MSSPAAPAEPTVFPDVDPAHLPVFFHDVTSADGTRLRAWTNDPDCLIDGPTVLLCNGLGTNAWTAPGLLRPDCGVRVISWNHRGTGGSERPEDRDRVGIEHFVEDAIAVLDHAGVERATLMGWSMGVNTMFELAAQHPERVNGLFAVAGVPGDTFATMLAPLGLPKVVSKAVTVNLARAAKLSGRALTPLTTRLPVGPLGVDLLTRTGFMFPPADVALAARAIREFLTTPVEWYFHLALHTARHPRVSLSAIDVPTAFVAGRWDVLAGPRDMASAADRIEGATYVELHGTHFVMMERPERVHELLLELLARVP
ncbi:alpha/beta fold hydrolase [Nocardioides donggukensis]|uniref:Alpha/beta hydrolase n=1 Tax=Nocardioides donggukensis TaxID=2774019 RepID=A0A927K2N8_9ACTN|nr:alpha/beta hydrolase [Nocardioides donggukensis]MBD8868954.1 alpha/beta hydrolase [Nocardioides donggukensis]